MKFPVPIGPDPLCRWIFEYSDFGIIITDNDLNILHVNTWIENHTARTNDDLKCKLIFDAFPEITERKLDHYLRDALNGAAVILSARFHNYLIELPPENGGESPRMRQTVRISPLFRDEAISGIIIHIEDVTERLSREEEMQRKNEELQDLISMKDKFFKIVAHDLRGPFIAILSLSEILTSDASLTPEKTKELLDMIHTSVKNQYNFLENLLKWSQLQSGKFEMFLTQVKIGDVISHILRIAEPTIQSKEIVISENEVADNLVITTDRQSLTTILYNIIFNAVKFTNPGGRIDIRTAEKQDRVIVSIQDNGVGIPEDRISKLFSIGESKSTRGTRNEKGSGLGLILVKELAEKIGGKVSVESRMGEGTTFYVSLPLKITT